MIPTIEQIIDDLIAGVISKSQAVSWLHQHAADAHADLRDHFAGLAMSGFMANSDISAKDGLSSKLDHINAMSAYKIADAMMAARYV